MDKNFNIIIITPELTLTVNNQFSLSHAVSYQYIIIVLTVNRIFHTDNLSDEKTPFNDHEKTN